MTALALLLAATLASAGALDRPSDDPRAIESELRSLREAKAHESSDPEVLVRLAGLYLDLGDDLQRDPRERRAAYEEGARLAQHALEIREADAEAHYLYAANLGSAAQLTGMIAAAFTVRSLKRHVTRALELQPDHAPALHMMGMMLEELPWILGGDQPAALQYLQRAVAADPNYAHARLDLAKVYLKAQDREAARRELRAVIAMEHPRDRYAWSRRYLPDAEQLLAALDRDEGRAERR
jgi:tetratricopeptide (TPR) repeat protein